MFVRSRRRFLFFVFELDHLFNKEKMAAMFGVASLVAAILGGDPGPPPPAWRNDSANVAITSALNRYVGIKRQTVRTNALHCAFSSLYPRWYRRYSRGYTGYIRFENQYDGVFHLTHNNMVNATACWLVGNLFGIACGTAIAFNLHAKVP